MKHSLVMKERMFFMQIWGAVWVWGAAFLMCSLTPTVAHAWSFKEAGKEREAAWESLLERSSEELRRVSQRTGLAVHRIDGRLRENQGASGKSAGLVLDATSDEDVLLYQTEIDVADRRALTTTECRGFFHLAEAGLVEVSVLSTGPFEVRIRDSALFAPQEWSDMKSGRAVIWLDQGLHPLEARFESLFNNGRFRCAIRPGDEVRVRFDLGRAYDDGASARNRLMKALEQTPTGLENEPAEWEYLGTAVGDGTVGAFLDEWSTSRGRWAALSNEFVGEFPTALPSVLVQGPSPDASKPIVFPRVSLWESGNSGCRLFPRDLFLGGCRMLWSTAPAAALFTNSEGVHLLVESASGREVEFGFSSSELGEIRNAGEHRVYDFPNGTVAVVLEEDGAKECVIMAADGSTATIRALDEEDAEGLAIWRISGDEWAVRTDLTPLEFHGSVVRVRVEGPDYPVLEIYPKGRVRSLSIDGETTFPEATPDFDRFRLRVRPPKIAAVRKSDDRFTVVGDPNDGIEEVLCRVETEGAGGVLRIGGTVLGSIPAPDRRVEFPVGEALKGGERTLAVDFAGSLGRIRSLSLAPILIKEIRFESRRLLNWE